MSLPAQFRIFRKGANPSTKGTVYFDDIAAKDVMADHAKRGVDIMLDLEHLSLDRKSPNYNPNAMGWFKLAVKNGELWAVGVKGTPEGNERVDNKKQRYTSPFFAVDPQTKRVKCIINAALTALPATDKPMALVAANQVSGLMAFSTIGNNMDLSALLELLGLPPEATLEDIVAAVKALQDSGAKPAAGASPTAEALAEPDMGGATAPPGNPSATPKKTTVSIQHTQDTSGPAIIALTREVAALKADKLKDKRDALIVANASKLTPVLEAWARTQSIETLTAYFSAATPLEGVDTEAQRETNTNTDTETIALSQAEIDICNMTGTSLEAALAYKKGNK